MPGMVDSTAAVSYDIAVIAAVNDRFYRLYAIAPIEVSGRLAVATTIVCMPCPLPSHGSPVAAPNAPIAQRGPEVRDVEDCSSGARLRKYPRLAIALGGCQRRAKPKEGLTADQQAFCNTGEALAHTSNPSTHRSRRFGRRHLVPGQGRRGGMCCSRFPAPC
jgi:hypothetical protein